MTKGSHCKISRPVIRTRLLTVGGKPLTILFFADLVETPPVSVPPVSVPPVSFPPVSIPSVSVPPVSSRVREAESITAAERAERNSADRLSPVHAVASAHLNIAIA